MKTAYSMMFFERAELLDPFPVSKVLPFTEEAASLPPRLRILYALTAYADPDSGLVRLLTIDYLAAVTSLSSTAFNIYTEQLVAETPAIVSRARYHAPKGMGIQPRFHYRVSPELLTSESRNRAASFVQARLAQPREYRDLIKAVDTFENQAQAWANSVAQFLASQAGTLSVEGFAVLPTFVQVDPKRSSVVVHLRIVEVPRSRKSWLTQIDISNGHLHCRLNDLPTATETAIRRKLAPLAANIPHLSLPDAKYLAERVASFSNRVFVIDSPMDTYVARIDDVLDGETSQSQGRYEQ